MLPLQTPCSDQGTLYPTMPPVKPVTVTTNRTLEVWLGLGMMVCSSRTGDG